MTRGGVIKLVAVLVSLVVVAVCIGAPWWVGRVYTGVPESYGRLQDAFAAPAALFSALAFVGLIWTVVLQQDELRAQRKQFQEQVKELGQQSSEAMLLGLLNQLNDLRNNVVWETKSKGRRSGRSAIREINDHVRKALVLDEQHLTSLPSDERQQLIATGGPGLGAEEPVVVARWEVLYTPEISDALGHLFRTTYVIARFIDEDEHLNKDVSYRILRSQWSQAEMALLFYNAVSPRGAKMRALIDEHHLLQNLHSTFLAERGHRAWTRSRLADDGE